METLHAGGGRHDVGEGSCWWGRIMLVGNDPAGGGRLLIMRRGDVVIQATNFGQKGPQYVHSQHELQQTV